MGLSGLFSPVFVWYFCRNSVIMPFRSEIRLMKLASSLRSLHAKSPLSLTLRSEMSIPPVLSATLGCV